MTVVLTFALLLADPGAPLTLERVGRLEHPAIREASGLVRSRKHAGVFWVHNDSGNPPRLFAVRRDGSLIREYAVNVPNVDWEDITTDDAGHLYIGEIGNNDGRLPLRAVYRLDEPDPSRDDGPSLGVTTACYYRFAPGLRFDAEGLAFSGGRALIVAKTLDGREAEVYAVPFSPPASLLRPATPELVGRLAGFRAPVTGASLSPDGLRLAVCGTKAVGVYAMAGEAPGRCVFLRAFRPDDGQVEAITWDGDDLILAGEGRDVYRIAAAVWRGRPAAGSRPARAS